MGFLWGTSSVCVISHSSDGDSGNCSPRIQLGKTVHYLPILFIDQLSNRVKDLMVSASPPALPELTHVSLTWRGLLWGPHALLR